jgi:hypothetical protein
MVADVLRATLHLVFAFDVGYEIDLKRTSERLQGGQPGPLPRRRRTPESIQYRPPPLRLAMPGGGMTLPQADGVEPAGAPRAELAVFDFGAISLVVSIPLCVSREALAQVAGELGDLAPQAAAARRLLGPWIEELRPAITGFDLAPISEEFVLFQLDEVHPRWLEEHSEWVASLVRLDPGPLRPEEVLEATRLRVSNAPNDLVVVDWAAALVADQQCEDTLRVLEFANVQLLEFRHIDDRLDDQLEAAYRLVGPSPGRRRPWPWWRVDAEPIRRIRELEVEATSLFERADNALKLIGDQYLARVFGLASARFHLGDWEASIRRKLEAVGAVYDLLVGQASGRRMEVLEIIVVVLIAVEIILALFRH